MPLRSHGSSFMFHMILGLAHSDKPHFEFIMVNIGNIVLMFAITVLMLKSNNDYIHIGIQMAANLSMISGILTS